MTNEENKRIYIVPKFINFEIQINEYLKSQVYVYTETSNQLPEMSNWQTCSTSSTGVMQKAFKKIKKVKFKLGV